jgi:hypothetical protein
LLVLAVAVIYGEEATTLSTPKWVKHESAEQNARDKLLTDLFEGYKKDSYPENSHNQFWDDPY